MASRESRSDQVLQVNICQYAIHWRIACTAFHTENKLFQLAQLAQLAQLQPSQVAASQEVQSKAHNSAFGRIRNMLLPPLLAALAA